VYFGYPEYFDPISQNNKGVVAGYSSAGFNFLPGFTGSPQAAPPKILLQATGSCGYYVLIYPKDATKPPQYLKPVTTSSISSGVGTDKFVWNVLPYARSFKIKTKTGDFVKISTTGTTPVFSTAVGDQDALFEYVSSTIILYDSYDVPTRKVTYLGINADKKAVLTTGTFNSNYDSILQATAGPYNNETGNHPFAYLTNDVISIGVVPSTTAGTKAITYTISDFDPTNKYFTTTTDGTKPVTLVQTMFPATSAYLAYSIPINDSIQGGNRGTTFYEAVGYVFGKSPMCTVTGGGSGGPASSPPPPLPPPKKTSLSIGAIIGIVIGVLVFIGIIAGAVVYTRKK